MKISGTLKQIEAKKVVKENKDETTQHTAVFEGLGVKVTVKRDDIAFDGLVIGQDYDIKISSPQTTLR